MRLYRVIKFFSQALLCMLVFASCTWERMETDCGTGKKFSRGIIYFRIANADGAFTRANGDLENGSNAEHVIGTTGNYALFFDASDNLSTISPLVLPTMNDAVDDNHQREVIYGSRIETEDNLSLPKSCLLILNGERLYEQLVPMIGKSLTDILRLSIWRDSDPYRIGWNDDGYFTMTNAVYQDGAKVVTAVSISPNMVQDEGTFNPEKVLIIHVERMLSKFDLSIERNPFLQPEGEPDEIYQPSKDPDIVLFDDFHVDGSPKYTAKRWRIEVSGWGLNALETSSNLFKKISENGSYFSGWNDPANYRTYWAEDLTYDASKYPWQYRDVGYESAANIPFYSAEGVDEEGMTRLKNYSFNDLGLNRKDDDEERANHFGRTIYAPESTFDAASVRGKHDDRDEMLAATHLILGAQLQIEQERNSGNYKAVDIFRERSGFFYLTERDVFAVQMHAMNQLLSSQKSMDYVYYTWDKGLASGDKTYDLEYVSNVYRKTERPIKNGDKLASKPAEISTSETYYNKNYNFGVYWIDDKGDYTLLDDAFFANECKDQASFEQRFGSLALGELPGGDGQRLPWPVKGKIVICNENHVAIDIYTQDFERAGQPTRRERLRAANANDVKSLLYEWIGATDHFNGGRMYYACGIDHVPGVTTDGDNHEFATGSYGIVRNNWYQFKLMSISGVGVPVDDPEQPIVPDRAGPNDQINAMVSILDWHTESTVTPPAGI